MLYAGVDLGGTNIKVALVDAQGQILAQNIVPTGLPRPAKEVCCAIASALEEAIGKSGHARDEVAALGVGCPGTVEEKTGTVRYANNLSWQDVPAADWLREMTGLPTVVGNDANVAALGEALYGCAKGAQSAVIITLGTGVGGGIVIEGHLVTGFNGAASELGHMVIVPEGEMCTCGQRGCLETYVSATALLRDTRCAMKQHPDSYLHTLADRDGLSGQTPFAAAAAGDPAAMQVVNAYVHHLALGVGNIINILFPEVIGLTGGVANQGETLLKPLREEVRQHVYGIKYGVKMPRIVNCTLGYRAGLTGAAALAAQHFGNAV